MKLTCVTAVFNAIASGNRERLLRCVQSVALLKMAHEHLIYDGGSTDGTVDLLRKLEGATPGVKVVSEPDAGIYNALNKGVRDAHGEWFYVLGCDDYIEHPEVMDRILSVERRKVQVVATYVLKDFGDRQCMWPFSRRNLLFGAPYGHQGILMRTDFIREMHGFDEAFCLAADFDLMQRYHLKGARIEYVCDQFAVYSAGGSSENPRDSRGTDEPLQVMKKNLGLSDDDVAIFVANMHLPILLLCHYLLHKDSTVRLSAGYLLLRRSLSIVWPKMRKGIYQ